jgi:small nuclear ribonucleoprotein D3
MSVVGNNRVGIPIVLLHDAEGAVITVETKRGELIRGLLFEAEDMMNLYLKKAVVHGPQPGAKRNVEQIYVRGTEIVFIVLPEMLRHAPMFNRIKHWRKYGGAPPEGVGAAVGQAAAILRKASERRRGGFGGGGGRGGGGGFGGRGGPPGGGGGRGGGPPMMGGGGNSRGPGEPVPGHYQR